MHPSKTIALSSRTMFSLVLAITFCALLITACGAGVITSSGGETFGSETAGDGDGPHTPECVARVCESEGYPVGEMWGPCPTIGGVHTLCNDSTLACVPSVDITHNVCLPINHCPAPPYGSHGELGWGGACYPRCTVDADCATGQGCTEALADGGSMCAWPV